MKTIYATIPLLALSLGFVGCESVEESLSQPATNPQEPLLEASSISVTLSSAPLNLITIQDAKEEAQVATSSVQEFPAQSKLQLIMELSKDEDYTNPAKLTCHIDSTGKVTISPEVLNEAYQKHVTYNLDEGEAYVRFIANAVNGSEVVRIGGPDYYYGTGILKITPLLPNVLKLYTPGSSNGWNQNDSQILTTGNYVNFQGYAHLSGEFKFTSQPNWDGINYGAGDEEGVLSTDGSAGNLTVDKDGLYWCEVNLGKLTYSTTYISTIGIIGGFNGWSGSDPLTPSSDFLTWTIKDVKLSAGEEWKFRANDGWDINLGGNVDDLTQGGSNLVIEETGTYDIVLNLASVPYTCTLTKK